MLMEITVKTISIGARSFITQLPNFTSVILAWNAVWAIKRYSPQLKYRVPTGPILLPSKRIVLPIDYWGILSTPNSEPMLAIDLKVMDVCAERSSGKHFSTRTRTILATMDGTAYYTPEPYAVGYLSQQTDGIDNYIELSACSKFQLAELIGEKHIAQVKSTMRTKLRKLYIPNKEKK